MHHLTLLIFLKKLNLKKKLKKKEMTGVAGHSILPGGGSATPGFFFFFF